MRLTGAHLMLGAAMAEKPTETLPEPPKVTALAPAQETIQQPGSCYKLRIYPHPKTGEPVRGYRRLSHSIMYYSPSTGKIYLYSPPTDRPIEQYEAEFLKTAPADIVIADRAARRATYMADRRKQKKRRKERAKVATQ